MSTGERRELLYVVEVEVLDPGIEDEWNAWYSNVHLAEFVEIPGIVRGDRYVTESDDGRRRYITIYELESVSAIGSPEFAARRSWGGFEHGLRYRTGIFSRLTGAGSRAAD